MNQMYAESKRGLERTAAATHRRARSVPRWVRVTSVILIWLTVAGGCFLLARYYVGDIQGKLDTIAATNAAETEQLNQKLAALQTALETHKQTAATLQTQFAAVQAELTAVKEEMSLAGSSLSSTAETKQALNARINDLSKELNVLRALIKKLEEAARVY